MLESKNGKRKCSISQNAGYKKCNWIIISNFVASKYIIMMPMFTKKMSLLQFCKCQEKWMQKQDTIVFV